MRPCGIIVLLSELYIAESKSQVYGYLHNYYVRYPHAAQKVSNEPSFCILSIVVTYIWDGMDSLDMCICMCTLQNP